ncbi:MAG: sensor histidine kinase [Bacteroidales bacterium]
MNQRPSPDTVDTRIVFRIYAGLAAIGGFLLLLPPPAWLGTSFAHDHWQRLVFFRFLAALLFAAACVAMGFAQVTDARARHRALAWFIGAHMVVLAMVAMQELAFDGAYTNDLAVPILLGAVMVLGYFWQTGDGYRAGGWARMTSLFDQESPEQLRSRYEEQIREAASQEERNRLARELHDSIKQQIFVMQTSAATAEARFETDPRGTKQAIAQLRESARDAMTEMEAMLHNLRAAPLESVGLVEALRKQCETLGLRTGAQVDYSVGDLPPSESLPPGAAQVVFRVAQEALANVARHARATKVAVSLGSAERQVRLEVRDNGQGFDQAGDAAGMGLRNMKARAAEIRGIVAVTSRPGEGTVVRMTAPLAPGVPDMSDFRDQVRLWTVLFVINLMLAVVPAARHHEYVLMFTIVPWSAVVLARSIVAYARARRLRARLSSWTASPSHS